MKECHYCNGTGKDEDAVRAASYPDHCINCHGKGFEQEGDTEDEYEEPVDMVWGKV